MRCYKFRTDLRPASTIWWKLNKNENLFKSNLVYYCYFNVYYFLNKLRLDQISFPGRSGTRC